VTENCEYDLRYISLGAGVQSTALYLMAVEGELTPKPDFALFADTQSEPKHVMSHLSWLRENFGHIIPIETATGGNLRQTIVDAATLENPPRFASVPFWSMGDDGREAPSTRQCTEELKIRVLRNRVRDKLGLSKGERAAGKYSVECWIGISLDEVTRAKPSRDSWVTNRFPLLYDTPMRRGDCLQWMEERGYPEPGRSACTFCPYHSMPEWRAMREQDPDSFEDACQVDEVIRVNGPLRSGGARMRNLQYVHRSLRPLREVIDDPDWDETRQVNMFEEECEGVCGV